MHGCAHRDPPGEIVDDQPVTEPVRDEPLALWIEPGVSVRGALALPREHDRGVCGCDACRSRGRRRPRFT